MGVWWRTANPTSLRLYCCCSDNSPQRCAGRAESNDVGRLPRVSDDYDLTDDLDELDTEQFGTEELDDDQLAEIEAQINESNAAHRSCAG